MKRKHLYIIRNKISGKKYVGMSVNPRKRWHQHRSGKPRKGSDEVFADLQRFGEEAFELHIIGSVPPREVDELERLVIREHNTLHPHGYNKQDGGIAGFKNCEQTLVKYRNRESPMKGKSPSEETRQRISESLRGQSVSKETRRKLSDIHKGKRKSPSHRQRTSAAHRARYSHVESRQVVFGEIINNNTRRVTIDGVPFPTMKAAAEELGVNVTFLHDRLRGRVALPETWTVEQKP